MKKYYDPKTGNILCLEHAASKEAWGRHWSNLVNQICSSPPKNRSYLRTTKKYLPLGSKVVEGGSGLSTLSENLRLQGFTSCAVDFSSTTLRAVKQHMTGLDAISADVFHLPFQDNTLDGYWSLGVIEHFIQGYDGIIHEMHRTLRPGGIIFLTFPTMNILRKFKVRQRSYPTLQEGQNLDNFYQYMLDDQAVKKRFEQTGFTCLSECKRGALKGLRDDLPGFRRLSEIITFNSAKLAVPLRYALDLTVGWLAGHISLQIYQKR